MANLVFYEGWTDTLQALSKIKDIQFAKDVAWEIINYGTKGKYTTDDKDLIDLVNGMCSIQIEKSQKRYAASKINGNQGGRPKEYSDEDIMECLNKGMSVKNIAEQFGCSTKTVQRVKNKLKEDEDEDLEI